MNQDNLFEGYSIYQELIYPKEEEIIYKLESRIHYIVIILRFNIFVVL